jgi:hypothetical protein
MPRNIRWLMTKLIDAEDAARDQTARRARRPLAGDRAACLKRHAQ